MANVVGERFQITIGKKVREELGVKAGDLAIERVEDGHLVVSFVPRPHRDSLLGILRPHATVPVEPIEDWAEVKDRAWSARSAEIADALRDDGERHRTVASRPSKARKRR